MKLATRIIDLSEVDVELYRDLYYKCSSATPFQNLSWLTSIEYSSYGYHLRFQEYKLGNKIVGYYPFFQKLGGLLKVSSIRGGYDGCVYDENQIAFPTNIKSLVLKRNKVLDGGRGLVLTSESLNTWVRDVSKPYQDIIASLHKKTRNQIKKSLTSGVVIRNAECEKDVKISYELYEKLVIKHKIVKPLNYETFESLMQCDGVDFLVALYDGKVISFSVFIYSKNECFYWLNASDSEHSKLNATNGMLNFIIEKLTNDDRINILNFGAVPIGNDGLTHFKDRWGASKVSYNSIIEVVL